MGPGARNIVYHASEAQKQHLIPGMVSVSSEIQKNTIARELLR